MFAIKKSKFYSLTNQKDIHIKKKRSLKLHIQTPFRSTEQKLNTYHNEKSTRKQKKVKLLNTLDSGSENIIKKLILLYSHSKVLKSSLFITRSVFNCEDNSKKFEI